VTRPTIPGIDFLAQLLLLAEIVAEPEIAEAILPLSPDQNVEYADVHAPVYEFLSQHEQTGRFKA
jgi:hypothetical protein